MPQSHALYEYCFQSIYMWAAQCPCIFCCCALKASMVKCNLEHVKPSLEGPTLIMSGHAESCLPDGHARMAVNHGARPQVDLKESEEACQVVSAQHGQKEVQSREEIYCSFEDRWQKKGKP